MPNKSVAKPDFDMLKDLKSSPLKFLKNAFSESLKNSSEARKRKQMAKPPNN